MGNREDIINKFDQNVMPTYAPKLVLVKGQGAKVWDADGKEYLDFLAGISVLNVGHSHPAVVKAIQDQSAVLTHVSNLYYTEQSGTLAERLNSLALGGKGFFGNSGAEANEGLIKLARSGVSEVTKRRVEIGLAWLLILSVLADPLTNWLRYAAGKGGSVGQALEMIHDNSYPI